MPENVREQSAAAATQFLIHHPVFASSRYIGCYFANKNEFETKMLIEAIWQAGKVCYLPVLTADKTLHFARYDRNDELQLNQYHIPEPVGRQHFIPVEKLELVLLPLVAFDNHGNRIGTGGGYYDRTFAFLFNKPEKAPFMLGVGYQLQECESVQPEPWDIKLNGVLTETGVHLFKQHAY